MEKRRKKIERRVRGVKKNLSINEGVAVSFPSENECDARTQLPEKRRQRVFTRKTCSAYVENITRTFELIRGGNGQTE